MEPDNSQGAPVIPAGTNTQGGVAYNPLIASQQASGAVVTNAPIGALPQAFGQGAQVPVVPVQQQPANTQNAPTGTTFAELAQKKGWTTPDDMAKSYANLESHNTKVEMTAADIIKAVYPQENVQTPIAPIPPPVAATPPTSDAQAIQIVQGIVRATTKPLEEQLALQNLFIKNPDAKDFAEGIAKAVKENPGIPWEAAYKLAKYDALEQKAKEAGTADAARTAGLRSATMVGSPSPTAQRGGPDLSSVIKDRSIPFAEVTKMVTEALSNRNS